MTPFEKFLQFLVSSWRLDLALLAKGSVLLLYFLFFMFSLVVVRQVDLMTKTIHTQLDKPLRIAAYLLVGLAVAAFIFSLWTL